MPCAHHYMWKEMVVNRNFKKDSGKLAHYPVSGSENEQTWVMWALVGRKVLVASSATVF